MLCAIKTFHISMFFVSSRVILPCFQKYKTVDKYKCCIPAIVFETNLTYIWIDWKMTHALFIRCGCTINYTLEQKFVSFSHFNRNWPWLCSNKLKQNKTKNRLKIRTLRDYFSLNITVHFKTWFTIPNMYLQHKVLVIIFICRKS